MADKDINFEGPVALLGHARQRDGPVRVRDLPSDARSVAVVAKNHGPLAPLGAP